MCKSSKTLASGAMTPANRVDIISLKVIRESSILYGNRCICSPKDAANLMKEFLEDADREKFCLTCLNTKNEPTSIATVSVGTINTSLVHPRELFKVAIVTNATSVIIFHNHPSGDPTPSKEDLDITKRLVEAGEILGISILDHIIIGSDGRYISLKEKGIIG